jgi:hypothetical protein
MDTIVPKRIIYGILTIFGFSFTFSDSLFMATSKEIKSKECTFALRR